MSNQQAGAKKENDSGSSIGTKLLLAGGAAAIGFLASQLWTDYKEFQREQEGHGASSSRPSPRGPPPSNSSWGDGKTSNRKKNRDKMGDLNVPEEMRCVACLENAREVVLLPCNHVCLCEDCVENIGGKCPICRERVRDSKVIYMS